MYFEDYTIDEVRTSRGRTITEADIVNFAGLSEGASRTER
jgi:acyl dehydratase